MMDYVSQINAIESESEEELQVCRICLLSDKIPMISPCKCKGSYQFVHEECLKKWIQSKYADCLQSKCEICHHNFNIVGEKEIIYDPKNAREENFGYFCVIPPLIFLIIVLCIILILLCVLMLDFKNNSKVAYIVLGIFIFVIISSISVVLLFSYKVKFRSSVKNWKISNFRK